MINADARVLGASLKLAKLVHHPIEPGRHVYLVSAKGRISVNDVVVEPRDGVAIKSEALNGGMIRIEALDDAEIVMVDSI